MTTGQIDALLDLMLALWALGCGALIVFLIFKFLSALARRDQ
jgi:hypothetical protein